MHALIIEDECLIAFSIEDVLRKCGFTSFDFAPSAETAISFAKGRCPDLITADVQLRPGCGIDAVQAICGSIKRIPVLFITGSKADVMARFPLSMVVEKPFSEEALLAAVSALLGYTGDRPSFAA